MAHSLGQLRRNFLSLFGRMQPWFFKFTYYFALPAMFVYGKQLR